MGSKGSASSAGNLVYMQYVLYVTSSTVGLSMAPTCPCRDAPAAPEVSLPLSATRRATAPSAPIPRRTQSERSDAMRKRLVEATLVCLGRDGYSGTTVSSVVRQAGVSRGAHLHHFPNKNALILAAADRLLRQAYRVLGELLLGVAQEDNRLQALVATAWKELFDTPMFNAFLELLMASQHDAHLARSLQKLFASAAQAIDPPIAHYFEPRGAQSLSPRDLFLMTPLMLSGLAAIRHLMRQPQQAQHYLMVWTQLMLGQMKARKGVRQPPPRPANWDVGAGGQA